MEHDHVRAQLVIIFDDGTVIRCPESRLHNGMAFQMGIYGAGLMPGEIRGPWEQYKGYRVAETRARALLDSMLTPFQRDFMRRTGFIPAIGNKTRRLYLIEVAGSSYNIICILGNRSAPLLKMCATLPCEHGCPMTDIVAAQLMAIQCNEGHLSWVANVNRISNPDMARILMLPREREAVDLLLLERSGLQ